MAPANLILFVQVEKEMSEDGTYLQIDHDDEKNIEAAGTYDHLIESTMSVAVNVVNVVDMWDAEFIEA